jgi:hypothetical protein
VNRTQIIIIMMMRMMMVMMIIKEEKESDLVCDCVYVESVHD